MKNALQKLQSGKPVPRDRLAGLIRHADAASRETARRSAERLTLDNFGGGVFIRGLIEFTNYCRNDCLYCGIRSANRSVKRFRLGLEDVLSCCRQGHELGFRTFVLQGGEDPFFTDQKMAEYVAAIRRAHPDCAITLSLGERSRESYQRLFEAGADRYLLRHETANPEHYSLLHPPRLTLASRLQCLQWLKEIGYQVGCGFMVGSPGQTPETLADDLLFLGQFRPAMVGLGPFIPHRDTPFGHEGAGDVELTLFLLSLVRIILPHALIPATTALATREPEGREKGLRAGANVVMPNLSPPEARDNYSLYDNKLSSLAEAAENLSDLSRRLRGVGRHIVVGRGDYSP